MKEKRKILIGFVIVGVLLLVYLGSGQMKKEAREEKSGQAGELTEIRVAVQDYFLSAPIGYIVKNGLDEQFGLKLIPVRYRSGAEQIVDIDQDVYDVATIGAAFLYPMAKDQAVLIGEHVICGGEDAVFVRRNSPILQVKGFNPIYQEVYGDPDTVQGRKLLMQGNTTVQYLGLKWLESVGVHAEDVEIEYLDFDQTYRKFQQGVGDVAVLPAPYSYQAEMEGYVRAASMKTLSIDNYEVILATNQAYAEKKEELVRFLELMLYANEELETDAGRKLKACEDWYRQNGVAFTKDGLKKECRDKSFVTEKNYEPEKFGKFEYKYAEYMAAIGNIEPMTLKHIKENIAPELWEEAFERIKQEESCFERK